MSSQATLDQLKEVLFAVISDNKLIKVTLGNYQGNDKLLKNIYVRKVKIKRADKLSFTYRYSTRDVFKNLDISEGIQLIANLASYDFKVCNVFCTDREVYVEHNNKGIVVLRQKNKQVVIEPSLSHDKAKARVIKPAVERKYLNALQITDAVGKVYKNSQDKYRQINHYIDILAPLINELPAEKTKNVVDMGSGKGYLTFALYDYLRNILGFDAKVTGVEYREDLVLFCNEVAVDSNFDNLTFSQGTIQDFNDDDFNILIALHACDTATDDAIFKGIKADADLIVVAPCCHKQIRREIEKSKGAEQLIFLTKNGVFLERQAEMVTDGLRALILQYAGYKTKLMEFVSDVHTPKNVMIVATRVYPKPHQDKMLKEIQEAMNFFGIEHHHLADLMGI
ncbi:class I SAM-dependent methyltransferase [Pedobacter sp. JCM 36344]|uniref:class I SAM-dependent methyltransferase n=1 Tax=Pedobacter sp. JCM 36344 TaxID=3374280 RepID=UPI00397C651D